MPIANPPAPPVLVRAVTVTTSSPWARSVSAVPSVEALSTTTTRETGRVWDRSADSTSRSRSCRFQVTTTATTEASGVIRPVSP